MEEFKKIHFVDLQHILSSIKHIAHAFSYIPERIRLSRVQPKSPYFGPGFIIQTGILLLCLTSFLTPVKAQKFGGALILGLNASQIDGDQLAGYDKLGLTGGLKVSYALKKPWGMAVEMLYSQRGSQTDRLLNTGGPIRTIDLKYIEIPVTATYADWHIQEGNYYKVNAEAGLSYGYLFNAYNAEDNVKEPADDLLRNDISFLFGGNYFFNKRWGLGFRYTRSFTKLKKFEDTEKLSLLGYFLTFRGLYRF